MGQRVSFMSSAFVHSKDPGFFVKTESRSVIADTTSEVTENTPVSPFSLTRWTIREAVKKKQLLLFLILQVPLRTEEKENGKS